MATLWSLRGLSLQQLAIRSCRKSWDDEVFGQSARLAFYFFFALFPLLLLLLIVLGESVGSGSGWRSALFDLLDHIFPRDASALIAQTVRQLDAKATIGTGAILAGAGAAWGTLNGTWSIISGLNKAYEVKEERPWWSVLSITLGLTILLSVLGMIALTTIRYGGMLPRLEILRHILEWGVIVVLLLVSFAVLYRFGPNLKDRRWQWSVPGAVVATTLLISLAGLLRVYQEHASSSQRICGGLNAVATLLLWLYLAGAAIFIGGEVNSEIEKAATEGGNPDVRKAGERRSGGTLQTNKDG